MYDTAYQDIESNCIYLHARYYAPSNKTFISQDSYLFFNRYQAFDDDPIERIDPRGHASFKKGLVKGVRYLGTPASALGIGIIMAGVSSLLNEDSLTLRAVFVLGHGLPNILQSIAASTRGQYLSVVANLVFATSGFARSVASQPNIMSSVARLSELSAKDEVADQTIENALVECNLMDYRRVNLQGTLSRGETSEALKAGKDVLVNRSAILSIALLGAGGGLQENYIKAKWAQGTGYRSSMVVSLAFLGAFSGKFYGFVSAMLPQTNNEAPLWKVASLGALRGGIAGNMLNAIQSGYYMYDDIKHNKARHNAYLASVFLPFATGAISGLTQNWQRSSKNMASRFARTSYLFARTPIFEAMMSNNTINKHYWLGA
ncbi:hypothetical protein IB691_03065 [Fangia hongkongensis]|nr:hypothetical protein [Fangia hongkongensis]